jgi:hypothetical protein
MDVYAAQQAPKGPVVLVIVTDVIHIVPGKHAGTDPKDYDGLAWYGAEILHNAHAELAGTEYIRMFGLQGVEVTGDSGRVRISIRMLYRGYRRFEFRCFDVDRQPEWRCASALTSFRIEDVPEHSAEQDAPRVRHLRDSRFGVAFDAPDDSWLSIGPRVAGGGAQIVWLWNKSGRQIEVQVIDLSAMPRKPDETSFARGVTKRFRTSGKSVLERASTFAGRRWHHLEVNSQEHGSQDLFILVEQDVMYGILVTQPSRDKGLLEAAKNGFRLIPKSTSSHQP